MIGFTILGTLLTAGTANGPASLNLLSLFEGDAQVVLNGAAMSLQAAVSGYALWLNRIFGTRRAGWALFAAFVLMLAMHLNEAIAPPVGDSLLGLSPALAYVFISLLLLVGLSHMATLYRERERTEREIRQAHDLLEIRVQDRTSELAQEVEQRKRAESEIKASQQLYRGLVDSLDGIIFECEADDLTFTFVSPQSERLLGYSAEQWLREVTWRAIIHPDDYSFFEESCVQARQGKGSVALDFRVLRNENRTTWVRLVANLVTTPEGQPRIRGVLLDMTERKYLEDELRQAQKMEAVGRLAGGVAHDFNNLLTAIQGYGELLGLQPHAQSGTDYVKEICQAAARGAQLTRQLLAFSRKQAMHLEAADLNYIVAGTSKMLRVLLGENITLREELAADLPAVHADTGQLAQVLMNLAVNSRDAMAEGGQLIIRTEAVTFSEADRTADLQIRAGWFVCLTVSDNGVGIPTEALPQIFEPFFTTKEVGKGTGLGLSIVYSIVKQHGGWIKVETVLGQGTTFQVFLPAIQKPLSLPPAASRQQRQEANGETLLVVDDEPAVLRLASVVLKAHGYHVLEATSGPLALKIWEQHRDQIDLLFTDMMLPDGMSGWDLIQRIREFNPDFKAVIASGHLAGCRPDPQIPFLDKPYNSEALLKIIYETLHLDSAPVCEIAPELDLAPQVL